MPEGLEAEIYRRAADRCVGRTIATVRVDDHQPAAVELAGVLPGLTVTGTRRIGKLVLVDLSEAITLGLHFGMTGRLIVGGVAAIDRLEYASGRDDPAWDRLVLTFDGDDDRDGVLRVNDPRRWARFTLDPDESRLGPDVLDAPQDVLEAHLASVFERRRAAVKAVLLDQAVVAGFGNLCVDEVLWHAAVAPGRPARELTPDQVSALVVAAAEHLPAMLARGGSHRGTIDPEVRATLPPCPRDGAPLQRTTVGGRSTIWCPAHQW